MHAAIASDGKLNLRPAIDIFEQAARQLLTRAKARILDIQDRRYFHRHSYAAPRGASR